MFSSWQELDTAVGITKVVQYKIEWLDSLILYESRSVKYYLVELIRDQKHVSLSLIRRHAADGKKKSAGIAGFLWRFYLLLWQQVGVVPTV